MKLYESGEYRASANWPYSISAGCAVYRQKGYLEILLLVRKAGDYPELPDHNIDSYHLPKGHLKLAETLETAASRETAEEAGVNVKITTYLGMLRHNYKDQLQHDKAVHYFAGLWQSNLPFKDDEHSEVKWVKIDEAIELLKYIKDKPNPKQEHKILQRLKIFLQINE